MPDGAAPGPAGEGESPPALEISSLSKSFGVTRALSEVDLLVPAGQVHALLGENGSGKSTLIKVLSGYHKPEAGSQVRIGGAPLTFGSPASSYHVGCRVVHQDLGLVESLSIADNLSFTSGFQTRFATVRGASERRRAVADMARVGVTVDPRGLVGDLPAAEKTGLAIARALRSDPSAPVRLLVLDEPTATFPHSEVQQLLRIVRRLASQGVGVLYVTHRLEEVFEVADHVSVLRDGRKVGGLRRGEFTRNDLIHLLVGSELAHASEASRERHGPSSAAPVLRVAGIRSGSLEELSLSVRPGEIVGLSGITGSGRDVALSAIFGRVPRSGGTVHVGDLPVEPHRPDRAIEAGLAYLPADRKTQGGMMLMSARENLTLAALRPLWSRFAINRSRERTEVRRWFERFGIRPAEAWNEPLWTFSGGNQQKVLMAKWLRFTPKALLLDEPTQGVDVPAKAILHASIIEAAKNGTAIIISSADVDELVALCDRVVVLRNGRIAGERSGSEMTPEAIATLGSLDVSVSA